jgi:hypothetical protein
MGRHLVLAACLGAAFALSAGGASAAAFSPAPATAGLSEVVRVSGGCGYDFHRDYYGRCRPNGPRWGGPGWGWSGSRVFIGPRGGALVCPPGYHLGPDLHACWPN